MRGGALAVVTVVALGWSGTASAVEVTGSGMFNPYGSILGAGLELGMGPQVGVEVQASSLYYDYRDSSYEEEGRGIVAGGKLRWYPQAAATQKGFWVAGGLSVASLSWDWWDYQGGATTDSGSGSGTGVIPTLSLGWKFRAAQDRLVVDPQILFGYIVGTDTDSPLLAGGGLSVGWRFGP